MANKKITDLQLRDTVSDDLNFPGDDGLQTYRVTGSQLKDYIAGTALITGKTEKTAPVAGDFVLLYDANGNALKKVNINKFNPTTATGDIPYAADGSQTLAALPIGTTRQIMQVAGGVPTWGTGITGTVTNDNAAAGKVGEYVTASLASGSATALTHNTAKTITSISLTAGDWDVNGWIGYADGSGTTVTRLQQGISLTTNAQDGDFLRFPLNNENFNSAGGGVIQLPAAYRRVSIASTTTVYLVAYALFSVSTLSAYGTIMARRFR